MDGLWSIYLKHVLCQSPQAAVTSFSNVSGHVAVSGTVLTTEIIFSWVVQAAYLSHVCNNQYNFQNTLFSLKLYLCPFVVVLRKCNFL